MKEDFELQQVSLRTSRKDSLCLSAFVAKIGHEGTKTQRKLFRKGYLVSTLAGDLPKSNFLCVVQNSMVWQGQRFCCTTTEKVRATNDTNYHEIIRVIRGLIVTKKEKFPNKD